MKRPCIPFVYGRIVTGYEFVNRQSEVERLYTNLSAGLNTILISPRRWGKSSLVNRVVERIARADSQIRVCQFDLFNIRTEREFYVSLTREVLRSISARWEDGIKNGKNFLKNIIPRFRGGINPIFERWLTRIYFQ
jgi:uncharacterized protein